MSEVLIRLLLAVGIAACGIGAYRLVAAMQLARARGKSAALAAFERGKPGIVYFTTPDCVACKAAQRPALAALRARTGDAFQIVEIDAASSPELARSWGVLTVPTTFVVDPKGRPRHVNPGVASADKLLGQLRQTS